MEQEYATWVASRDTSIAMCRAGDVMLFWGGVASLEKRLRDVRPGAFRSQRPGRWSVRGALSWLRDGIKRACGGARVKPLQSYHTYELSLMQSKYSAVYDRSIVPDVGVCSILAAIKDTKGTKMYANDNRHT